MTSSHPNSISHCDSPHRLECWLSLVPESTTNIAACGWDIHVVFFKLVCFTNIAECKGFWFHWKLVKGDIPWCQSRYLQTGCKCSSFESKGNIVPILDILAGNSMIRWRNFHFSSSVCGRLRWQVYPFLSSQNECKKDTINKCSVNCTFEMRNLKDTDGDLSSYIRLSITPFLVVFQFQIYNCIILVFCSCLIVFHNMSPALSGFKSQGIEVFVEFSANLFASFAFISIRLFLSRSFNLSEDSGVRGGTMSEIVKPWMVDEPRPRSSILIWMRWVCSYPEA